jgi:heptaprenyl diphosphate synthase
LSQGIVARCEHQIKVYEAEKRSIEQWFASITNIESGLISKFFELYSFGNYIPMVEKSLLILRLERELSTYQNGQVSLMSNVLEESAKSAGATYGNVIQGKIVQLKTELLQVIGDASFLQSDVKQALQARVEASIASTNG